MLFGSADAKSLLCVAVLHLLVPQIATSQQRGSTTVTARRVIGLTYPRLANLAGIQGNVELVARVSSAGRVEGVRVLVGQDLLVDSAKRALLGWQFSCPDSSKPCEVEVSFDFQLLDDVCDKSSCPSELQIDLPNKVRVQAKRLPGSVD